MSNETADRMLIISGHTSLGASPTIGSKRAIALDFERAPKDGEGVWYCRNYHILGTLAFGARNITAAQCD